MPRHHHKQPCRQGLELTIHTLEHIRGRRVRRGARDVEAGSGVVREKYNIVLVRACMCDEQQPLSATREGDRCHFKVDFQDFSLKVQKSGVNSTFLV